MDVGSMYWTFDKPQDVGHAFLAIDVERMMPLANFKDRVAATLTGMRAVTRRPGVDRIYAPGDIERDAEVHRRAHGCPLTMDIIDSLSVLADQAGVEMPKPVG